MFKKLTILFRKPAFSTRRLARLAVLAGAVAALATATLASDDGADPHAAHRNAVPAKLVELVRNATGRFVDVNATAAAGYFPAFGCVSGPDHGAMGVHYINTMFVGDGQIDVTKPEALIYEPTPNGMRLVGVEFIVDAATWMANHTAPPMLEGQAFQLVNSPNRYGLPAFFELHVWAWRQNPNGAFVDWNTRVSCEGQ